MSLATDVLAWLSDPMHWTGADGVPVRVAEHLTYTGLAVGLAAAVAVPLGALIGHSRRGVLVVVGLANGVRAIPELGLLTLLVLAMGIGLLPLTVALAALAVPPLLAGTYAGVNNVDRATVDAAKGMGMRGFQVLWRVELPNALPLILAGLRVAILQVLATAVIAAFVAFGGLGRYLSDGLPDNDIPKVVSGAVLIAALVLLVEVVLAGVQRLVVSPGLRPRVLRAGRSTLGTVPPLEGGRR